MVLPTTYNYITGNAVGIDFSWYQGGNIFQGTMNNFFIPQTYTFGQGKPLNIFTNSNPYNTYGQYEFKGDISYTKTKLDGNIFTGAFSGSRATSKNSVKKTESTPKKTIKNNITTKPVAKNNIDIRSSFVSTANKYLGINEDHGEHKKFCVNHGCNEFNSGEWCTDFVSYVVKESYKDKGLESPHWFGDHDVATLKRKAVRNGKFTRTSGVVDKSKFISSNIKPGDIFILNENGASHTGFVTKVDNLGGFYTIEGNRDDKVSTAYYNASYKDLSGFIQLS